MVFWTEKGVATLLESAEQRKETEIVCKKKKISSSSSQVQRFFYLNEKDVLLAKILHYFKVEKKL